MNLTDNQFVDFLPNIHLNEKLSQCMMKLEEEYIPNLCLQCLGILLIYVCGCLGDQKQPLGYQTKYMIYLTWDQLQPSSQSRRYLSVRSCVLCQCCYVVTFKSESMKKKLNKERKHNGPNEPLYYYCNKKGGDAMPQLLMDTSFPPCVLLSSQLPTSIICRLQSFFYSPFCY